MLNRDRHCLQEMYDRTPLSRGESLDPNPLGQGEFIEHRHSPVTCNSALRTFPMLKVGLLQHAFIVDDFPSYEYLVTDYVFQKAKADPRTALLPGGDRVSVR